MSGTLCVHFQVSFSPHFRRVDVGANHWRHNKKSGEAMFALKCLTLSMNAQSKIYLHKWINRIGYLTCSIIIILVFIGFNQFTDSAPSAHNTHTHFHMVEFGHKHCLASHQFDSILSLNQLNFQQSIFDREGNCNISKTYPNGISMEKWLRPNITHKTVSTDCYCLLTCFVFFFLVSFFSCLYSRVLL